MAAKDLSLASLPDGKACLMRWPPTNGGFVMGFNAKQAREIKARGWIIVDGQYAEVTPTSRFDDDLRIDFQIREAPALELELAA